MTRSRYIAAGSNTTVKAGPGTVYRAIINGIAGSTVIFQDALGIGVAPNFPNIIASVASNLAVVGPVALGVVSTIDLAGIEFTTGLTVASTSNATFTVVYD